MLPANQLVHSGISTVAKNYTFQGCIPAHIVCTTAHIACKVKIKLTHPQVELELGLSLAIQKNLFHSIPINAYNKSNHY